MGWHARATSTPPPSRRLSAPVRRVRLAPAPRLDASLAELEYAFDELRANGVGLLSNYGGRHLGDPLFAPLLEELDRRSAVVHVHPIAPPSCRGLLPGYPDPFLEFPFDTTRAVTSLLYAGAFERWPRIAFIFSHGGGAVPMLSQRIVALAQMTGTVSDPLHQLTRIHADAVTTTSRPAFAAAPICSARADPVRQRLPVRPDRRHRRGPARPRPRSRHPRRDRLRQRRQPCRRAAAVSV